MIIPNWKAPDSVQAVSSTREGGMSIAPYTGLNLGLHVGDDKATVLANRHAWEKKAKMPSPPVWLNQTHSTKVVTVREPTDAVLDADGVFTDQPNVVCSVMTADCVPVLLANTKGNEVAAVHAGWRGLSGGILENAAKLFHGEVIAWIGPCISKTAFEVGDDVVDVFTSEYSVAEKAFTKTSLPGKWLGDLDLLVRQRLEQIGISAIYSSGMCTYTNEKQFYSYRRDGVTGRQASFVWIK